MPDADDADALPPHWQRLAAQAGTIRTHAALHRWLTGEDLQNVLAHSALIASWGDFRGGRVRYDVVSSVDAARTSTLDAAVAADRMRRLFDRWSAGTGKPVVLDAEVLAGVTAALPLHGRFILVHAVGDLRTDQHGCYAVLCKAGADPQQAASRLEALTGYIHMAFGQVRPLPAPSAAQAGGHAPTRRAAPAHEAALAAGVLGTALSDRELEILRWVEMGKTNLEIGTILDISAFTVKNHLQRIFKKLDVYSRVHAVSRWKDSTFHG